MTKEFVEKNFPGDMYALMIHNDRRCRMMLSISVSAASFNRLYTICALSSVELIDNAYAVYGSLSNEFIVYRDEVLEKCCLANCLR